MRKLARFDDADMALALCEVLHAADIDSELRDGSDNTQVVWIVAEADLPHARELLDELLANPDHERYRAALATAAAKRAPPPVSQPAPRPAPVAPRKSLIERARQSPVTFALLAASVLVALATQLGGRADIVRQLSIVGFDRVGGYLHWGGYTDLWRGQIWRLFTPVLIHFGPFHLLFNAFWLNDLAVPTERYQGSWRFAVFILFTAAVSNMAQLVFGQSPNFGGLSGIVYALVGYLWARGRADPLSGINLPKQWVVFFIVWLALGFTGIFNDVLGHMANFCHLGGFAAGALYGYIAALIATGRVRG
jgi:GlpG protein